MASGMQRVGAPCTRTQQQLALLHHWAWRQGVLGNPRIKMKIGKAKTPWSGLSSPRNAFFTISRFASDLCSHYADARMEPLKPCSHALVSSASSLLLSAGSSGHLGRLQESVEPSRLQWEDNTQHWAKPLSKTMMQCLKRKKEWEEWAMDAYSNNQNHHKSLWGSIKQKKKKWEGVSNGHKKRNASHKKTALSILKIHHNVSNGKMKEMKRHRCNGKMKEMK